MMGLYIFFLMMYRVLMGLLAIVFNAFFLHILRIFPVKDKSGYYKIMRPMLCFLASTDLLYGLCITTQVILYYESKSFYISRFLSPSYSFNHSSVGNDTLEDFLLGRENTLRSYSNVVGIIRQSTVKANVTLVFLITLTRTCLTMNPLQSMRQVCKVTTQSAYLFLFLTILPSSLLLNKNVYTSSSISDCYGLLVCETSDPVSCSTMNVVMATFSLLVCTVILAMILKTWQFALQKKREAERLLQLTNRGNSKNFKSVKVSLGISLVFLMSNSGPSLNNAVKLVCGVGGGQSGRTLEHVYYAGDVAEQWLLPLMTVLNCVVYTASNKAVRKFTLHYYRISFLTAWKKYKAAYLQPNTVSSVSYEVDQVKIKMGKRRGVAIDDWKQVLRREFNNTSI